MYWFVSLLLYFLVFTSIYSMAMSPFVSLRYANRRDDRFAFLLVTNLWNLILIAVVLYLINALDSEQFEPFAILLISGLLTVIDLGITHWGIKKLITPSG